MLSVADLLAELFPDGLQQSLLITLGNSLRRDDGVGPYLAERLQNIPGLCLENVGDRPERSIDLVPQYRLRQLVFVDAADFAGEPGEVRLIDSDTLSSKCLSSHRLPLAAVIAWIEREFSVSCHCLGVQVADMSLGEGLSPEVAASAEKMIDWFCQQSIET